MMGFYTRLPGQLLRTRSTIRDLHTRYNKLNHVGNNLYLYLVEIYIFHFTAMYEGQIMVFKTTSLYTCKYTCTLLAHLAIAYSRERQQQI